LKSSGAANDHSTAGAPIDPYVLVYDELRRLACPQRPAGDKVWSPWQFWARSGGCDSADPVVERDGARHSLSRNTIRKRLKAPVEGEPKYRHEARDIKLTPFHDTLIRALKADALRPRRERRTALALFDQ